MSVVVYLPMRTRTTVLTPVSLTASHVLGFVMKTLRHRDIHATRNHGSTGRGGLEGSQTKKLGTSRVST